jgi:hypothetical protein
MVMIIREPRGERRRGGGSKVTFRGYKILLLLEKKTFEVDLYKLVKFFFGRYPPKFFFNGLDNVWSRFGIFFLEVSHFRTGVGKVRPAKTLCAARGAAF